MWNRELIKLLRLAAYYIVEWEIVEQKEDECCECVSESFGCIWYIKP